MTPMASTRDRLHASPPSARLPGWPSACRRLGPGQRAGPGGPRSRRRPSRPPDRRPPGPAGETATGLAVRYHAWTAELIARNHLGTAAGLRVGQRLEIPVVVAALPHRHTPTPSAAPRHHAPRPPTQRARTGDTRRPAPATVRRAVAGDGRAATASTRSSRSRCPGRSPAGRWTASPTRAPIGAMQVLPSTAAWMSLYAGRRCTRTGSPTTPPPASRCCACWARETGSGGAPSRRYYQGLGAVRAHGLYGETRAYVANVLAIKQPSRGRSATGLSGPDRPPAARATPGTPQRGATRSASVRWGPRILPHPAAGGSLCSQTGTPARAPTRPPATP